MFGSLRRVIRRVVRAGVTLFLILLTAVVFYGAWLVDRLDVSRASVETRARTVEARIVPRIVAGPNGRSYDAQLELPLYLPPERIPDFVKNAFTTSEDRQFWWHPGVNPVSITRAFASNLSGWWHGSSAPPVGGSTITMQLVKNLLLSRERTLDRKFNEIILALVVEWLFTKDEILTMYLNSAYFGGGAYGIEVAARRFFGRSVGYEPKVDILEAAMLAKSVRSPSTLNPVAQRDVIESKARVLLKSMTARGFDVGKRRNGRKLGNRSWSLQPYLFRDLALRSMVPPDLRDRDDAIVLGLTIDTETQLYAERLAANLLETARPAGYDSSAIVVLKTDGALVALATGQNYDGIDLVGEGRVSPGSALKPFMYLCALEHGLRPSDKLDDSRQKFRAGWSPRNFDGRWLGRISATTALARSRNPPAVELYDRFGWRCFDEVLRRYGLTLDNPKTPTAVLGTQAVSLLSLAGAYASLANGGSRVEPYAVRYARDRRGRVLYRHSNGSGGAGIKGRAYCDLMQMLRKVTSAKGTGHLAAFDHPVWGKTGTSSFNRDSLFVGFTGHFAAVVWLGRQAPGLPSRGITGGDLPARTFRQLMATLHQGKAAIDLGCHVRVAGRWK